MIKIEFDLPEFEKELNISITLKKDGEVITTSSSLGGVNSDNGDAWKQVVQEEKVTQVPVVPKRKSGGNMMDISF